MCVSVPGHEHMGQPRMQATCIGVLHGRVHVGVWKWMYREKRLPCLHVHRHCVYPNIAYTHACAHISRQLRTYTHASYSLQHENVVHQPKIIAKLCEKSGSD